MSVMKRLAAQGYKAVTKRAERAVMNGEAWLPQWSDAGLGGAVVRQSPKPKGKAPFSVVVTGDAELDASMKVLPRNLQRKLFRQATRKAAKDVVLPDAQRRVSVQQTHKGKKGGTLRRSLTVRAIRRSRRYIGHEVVTKGGVFRGDTFYGGMIEFGTKTRTAKSYRGKPGQYNRGKIPKKTFAFMRPALYENADKIKGVFLDALRDFVREANRESAYRAKMGDDFMDEFRVGFGGPNPMDRVMRTAKSVAEARKMKAWKDRMGDDWTLGF